MPKRKTKSSPLPLRLSQDNSPLPESNPAEPDPPKVVQHKTGLRWCFDKGTITEQMFLAGERYGRTHRDAEIIDAALIKSSLENMATKGCSSSGTKTTPGDIDHLMQRQIVAARCERDDVQAFFDWDAGAVAVLSAICGRQLTPMEAARGDYRDTESMVRERAKEITAVLRAILTMLVGFYRRRDQAIRAAA